MHRRTIAKTMIALTAAALTASSLFGCAKNQGNHEKWVKEADGRWKTVRSALMVDMGERQLETGDVEQAEETVREALGVDPENPKLLTLAGRIQLERGRLERAYHLFNGAIEQDEKDPAPRYFQGVVFQRWQQHERAYQRYEEAYELELDNPSYLMAAAEMLVSLDRRAEAIEMLESKLNYFDQNASLRAALGHLCSMDRQFAKAVEYFREASLLSPESLRLREELALAQVAADQHEDAVVTLRELLRQGEMAGRTDLKRMLAEAYLQLGRQTDARNELLSITRTKDVIADDWIRLGRIAWQAGDLRSAMLGAQRAIRLDGQRHEGYLLAGMVWQKQSKLDEALRMFDRAAELAPASAEPLILRGIALQKAGKPAAAAEAYSRAIERDPEDSRAKRLLSAVSKGLH